MASENLLRNDADIILHKDLVLLSPYEQLLLFAMCFLPTTFTINELYSKVVAMFGEISDQVVIKNLRILKGRHIVAELGCYKKDRRVKAYGLRLKGIALALILSEMIAINADDYTKSDLLFRKIYKVKT